MEEAKKKQTENSGIVISSRIRLARNLKGKLFPGRMDSVEALDVAETIKGAVADNPDFAKYAFEFKYLKDMSQEEKMELLVSHRISRALVENVETGACLVSNDAVASILVNEEDHYRIQTIRNDFQLQKAWEAADDIDNLIEERLDPAFDEIYGYLTSCPSNVGTGMRASVLMHLPALVLTRYIKKVFAITNTIGLTVRGLYGEGTNAEGDMFQISNQITLGRTEEEIIRDLGEIVKQIMQKEKQARAHLMGRLGIQTEDRMYRALGVLSSARIISRAEAMKLLSHIRMGIDMGILETVDMIFLDGLIKDVQTLDEDKTLDSAKERAARIGKALEENRR